mgnify:FL=1
MTAIAFIGLGNMGSPMAINLVKAKHQVTVFDLMPDALETLRLAGAHVADSAAEAVKGAEVVITMLPAGKHVIAVYLGSNQQAGILDLLDKNTLLIDSSTIDVDSVNAVATAAQEKGLSMIDAPVSGGVAAATAGTLTFMCGGSSEAFERAKPILSAMGKQLFLAGDHGAGQIAKMCNNMLLAIQMAGTAEALQMGANNGLDPSVLSEIMLKSSGRNWSLEVYNPYPGVMESAPASNDFKPGFMVDLMAKDLGLAMDNAASSKSKTPLGLLAQSLYLQKQAMGDGQKDFSSVIELMGAE